MELTQDELVSRLRAIRVYLVKGGLTDVTIEYPGFLSIVADGREFHAGYQFDDEINDTGLFQVYDFTDGYQGDVYTLPMPDRESFEAIALWVALWVARCISEDEDLDRCRLGCVCSPEEKEAN